MSALPDQPRILFATSCAVMQHLDESRHGDLRRRVVALAPTHVWLTCAPIVALDSALEASQVAPPLPGGTIPSEPNPDHWSRV